MRKGRKAGRGEGERKSEGFVSTSFANLSVDPVQIVM